LENAEHRTPGRVLFAGLCTVKPGGRNARQDGVAGIAFDVPGQAGFDTEVKNGPGADAR